MLNCLYLIFKEVFMKNIKINNTLKEYLLYNLTGTVVFIIGQFIYLCLLLKIKLPYTVSSIISTFISAIMTYFLDSFIIFKNKNFSILKLIKIVFIQLFQFVPNFMILVSVVELFNVPESIAPMIPPIIITPIMFFISKKVLNS